MTLLFVIGITLALAFSSVNGDESLGEPMRFETPKMSEEEQFSPHTPKSFEITCDACTAIAYQVSIKLVRLLSRNQ